MPSYSQRFKQWVNNQWCVGVVLAFGALALGLLPEGYYGWSIGFGCAAGIVLFAPPLFVGLTSRQRQLRGPGLISAGASASLIFALSIVAGPVGGLLALALDLVGLFGGVKVAEEQQRQQRGHPDQRASE
jgi:hypothetical protein